MLVVNTLMIVKTVFYEIFLIKDCKPFAVNFLAVTFSKLSASNHRE